MNSTGPTARRSTPRNGSLKPAAEAGATTNLSTTPTASKTPRSRMAISSSRCCRRNTRARTASARNYTSARLKTLGKFSQTYGRFEARIKIPRGQGIWPAFWMLGDDIDKARLARRAARSTSWRTSAKSPQSFTARFTARDIPARTASAAPYHFPPDQHFADDFHVFAVEWEPKAIRFYVDDHLYATRTPADLPKGAKWVYDHPFFLLLNVAVGGGWPGNPDATRFSRRPCWWIMCASTEPHAVSPSANIKRTVLS